MKGVKMLPETKSFINEYGWEEFYRTKSMYMELTGHLYRNSPCETAHDCGNCDGGRCDTCQESYVVCKYEPVQNEYGEFDIKTVLFRKFFNKDEAVAFYNTL